MPVAIIKPDDKVCSKCGRFTARCSECNNEFFPQRRDTITCSGACRVARSRRIKKARDTKALVDEAVETIVIEPAPTRSDDLEKGWL